MSLRARAIKGGSALLLRQGAGLFLGLASLLFVTRIIGPEQYGIYAIVSGLTSFTFSVAHLGIGTYLVRARNVTSADFDLAFSFLTLVGAGLLALAYPLGLFVEAYTKIDGLAKPTTIMLAFMPLQLWSVVWSSYLERSLKFEEVAVAEVGGSLVNLFFAVLLAWSGWGFWAPLWGFVISRFVMCAIYSVFSQFMPKLTWDTAGLKRMLSYSLAYSLSMWVWQARLLVNPLIVAPLAGSQAAAYVALTVRVVEALSFAKSAAWRLSIAMLAKVQEHPERIGHAVEEGMKLQTLAMAPFLLAFAVFGAWPVTVLLGPEWLRILSLFPFVALAYLVNGVFSLHSSALYVIGNNWGVAKFHLAHITLLFLTAALASPRFGSLGYGIAECIAIFAYWVVHREFASIFGAPRYGQALFWLGGFAAGLFYYHLGWISLAPLTLLVPAIWRETRGLFAILMPKEEGDG